MAYFSAEFGVHESLGLPAAWVSSQATTSRAPRSGVPLVGVGILYAQGYFRQRIGRRGRQQEVYESLEPESRPVVPARCRGCEVLVSVELPGREVFLKVWKAEVGRVSVLFLDADIPENAPGIARSPPGSTAATCAPASSRSSSWASAASGAARRRYLPCRLPHERGSRSFLRPREDARACRDGSSFEDAARRSPGTLSLLPTHSGSCWPRRFPGTSSASSPPGGPPL